MCEIRRNKDGTYTVIGVYEGAPVEETFDKLYEAKALIAQLIILSQEEDND